MNMRSSSHRACGRQTGFTLFEVLIVLVLIGVMAGLATLSLGDGAERELRREADRLATVLKLARDELLISGGSERALGIRRDSYSLLDLVLLDDATREWQPVNDAQLGPHVVTEGLIELDFEAANQPRSLSSSTVWTPQLRLSNTGEMTPGVIILRAREHNLQRFIQVELTGNIEVLSERP